MLTASHFSTETSNPAESDAALDAGAAGGHGGDRAVTALEPAQVAPSDGLDHSLAGLDYFGAVASVEQAWGEGAGSDALLAGLLAPALVEIGRRWAAAEIGAAEASAAAAIVQCCIARVTPPPAAAADRRGTVVVCCPPGERHEIPSEMVSAILRGRDWQVLHLGTGATPEQLPNFLAGRQPAALLVSCTTPAALPGAARMIAAAHRESVPVLVGGAAFGRDDLLALRLGAAGWARSAEQAVALLEVWQDRPPMLPGPRAWPEDYVAFEAGRAQIRAAVDEALGRDTQAQAGETGPDGAATLAESLLDHLGAALLVDDGRLFLDVMSWRAQYYQARDIGLERLFQAVAAIAAALPLGTGRALRFVDEGRQHLAWASVARTDDRGGLTRAAPVAVAPPAPEQPGQVFAALLAAAANRSHAAVAMISVPKPGKRWSTLRRVADEGGDRRDQFGEARLFDLVAGAAAPLEIADLADDPEMANTYLVRPPGSFRSAYGVPLRSAEGVLLGVLCVLDRRPRQLLARERHALAEIGRQVASQLVVWRGGQAANPGPDVSAHSVAPSGQRAESGRLPRRGDSALGLLHSHDVAVLFDVTDRTVINWARGGKLPSLRTAGGHLRFRRDDVLALLAGAPVGTDRAA